MTVEVDKRAWFNEAESTQEEGECLSTAKHLAM